MDDVGAPGMRPNPDGVKDSGPDRRARRLNVEVVYATRGRAKILSSTMRVLDHQTLAPQTVTVSCSSPSDIDGLEHWPGIKVLMGDAGLPKQRNRALRGLSPVSEIVVFFDDDFLPHPMWIEEVERCFRENPDVSAVTGTVVADGIKGPGLSLEEAQVFLSSSRATPTGQIWGSYSPYGCNMAFRRSAIVGLEFDERLVLYGWLEDRDFGGGLARRGGRQIKIGAAVGVHLGIKAGRMPGRRLGYSQVVNPVYLRIKGTMTRSSLIKHLFKNVTSNIVGSIFPESYIDRRGRLIGNLIGARDLLLGRARPERAEAL